MKKVLIVLCNFEYYVSQGKLNELLANETKKNLESKNYQVTIDSIKDGYDLNEEVKKIQEHDYIIFQYPIWWFNMPWQLKKWVDEVFMAGVGKLWQNDGRSEKDASKKYGTGGLLDNKKYMIMVTLNAPKEAFSGNQFLSLGTDNLLSNMHKACQFLKMEKMDALMFNNVIKEPNIEEYKNNLKIHLDKTFK